jgi:hypothetical protein
MLLTLLLPLAALAQPNRAVEFPATASSPNAQELSGYLSGRSFRGKYADGTPVQSRFGADGSLQADAPNFHDTGRWRTEDGRLCGFLRKVGEFCNDARIDSGVLYLRRMSGEIVRYESD